jgi:hypothetical protein
MMQMALITFDLFVSVGSFACFVRFRIFEITETSKHTKRTKSDEAIRRNQGHLRGLPFIV